MCELCYACAHWHTRFGGGGEGKNCSPLVLKFFGQSAYDSGKSTWDKLLFIESDFDNTTKRSILKSLNGSVANVLSAGNC